MFTRLACSVLSVAFAGQSSLAATEKPEAKRAAERRSALVKEGARIISELHSSVSRFHKERDLIRAAKARVDSGRKPTYWQRWQLSKLRPAALEKVAAEERLIRSQHVEKRPQSGWRRGGEWARAMDKLKEIEHASGRLTPERAAELARAAREADLTIFEEAESAVSELAAMHLHLGAGLGVTRYAELMWGIDGHVDGGTGTLKEMYKAASASAPERERELFARWARADKKLVDMRSAAKPPEVEADLEWRKIIVLQQAKDAMGTLSPERLLSQLARGDFAGWAKHLGLNDAEWQVQLQKGKQLSFGRLFERELWRIRETIFHRNPLRAREGTQALATIHRHLALAEKLGVTMDGPGETREWLRRQLTPEHLAELEKSLDVLASRAAEIHSQ
jgi:hypothetical protein